MRIFLIVLMMLLVGCSGKPETPLAGEYSSRVGRIDFDTTATADMSINGTKPFSGDIWDANWKRKGDSLTVTTRPGFKNQYQVTYSFDVVDDGAQLILRRIDVKTEATGETETIVMPKETVADMTFNKHN